MLLIPLSSVINAQALDIRYTGCTIHGVSHGNSSDFEITFDAYIKKGTDAIGNPISLP